ncbi:tryptophan transporter [Atopobium sp. oral taxon 810]|uniref:tryptophan transporter n=1 Tax=Atopobium sp. oral taxon 810 TaxID=712158 RepID=UPI0003F92A22|nr:tryptophan transporter [Atopobium sp. oral taxon 810]
MENSKSTAAKVRTIKSTHAQSGKLDVGSLVLVAILLAAGFILNATVGGMLAITGIKPEFCIAAYCLAILLLKPTLPQAIIFGILAATVIQITTSIPGVEYVADIPGAAVAFLLVNKFADDKTPVYLPFILGFVTTLVSGLIFACIATVIVLKGAFASMLPLLIVVLGTAVGNGLVVGGLYPALRKVISR